MLTQVKVGYDKTNGNYLATPASRLEAERNLLKETIDALISSGVLEAADYEVSPSGAFAFRLGSFADILPGYVVDDTRATADRLALKLTKECNRRR